MWLKKLIAITLISTTAVMASLTTASLMVPDDSSSIFPVYPLGSSMQQVPSEQTQGDQGAAPSVPNGSPSTNTPPNSPSSTQTTTVGQSSVNKNSTSPTPTPQTNATPTPSTTKPTTTPTSPTVSKPTVSLSASPTSVSSGSSSTLSWSATNSPTSCSASGGWSGTKAATGSASTGALSSTTSFTLSCSNAGGTGSASASVSVTSAPSCGQSGGACTTAQIATHNTRSNCWIYMSGAYNRYYNITSYVANGNTHPGGDVIVSHCGQDNYNLIVGSAGGHRHSSSAINSILQSYYVGPVQ